MFKNLYLIPIILLVSACSHLPPEDLQLENNVIANMNESLASAQSSKQLAADCLSRAEEARLAMEKCCGQQDKKVDRMFEKALSK